MKQPSVRFTHRPVRRRWLTARRGFGLIEVLVSLVITSIAIIGLGGMLVHAARTATLVSVRNSRLAAATQTINRLAAVPYASLESKAGCSTISGQPFQYTSCIAVDPVAGGSGAKLLRVIIRPLNTTVRADTLYLTRASGAATNPAAS